MPSSRVRIAVVESVRRERPRPAWLVTASIEAMGPSRWGAAGSGAPGRDDRLHNAFYQPDERCIALGVQALSIANAAPQTILSLFQN